MRATSTALENNRIKLVVEIDDNDMAKAMDEAAKSLAQQVSIKGFRKGKVPKQVLLANIGGPAVLRAEALRESIPNFYALAVSETLIDPINQPEINIVSGEEEGTLVFEADVEVRPTVALTGHHGLQVTVPSPFVTDDELEAQIDRFRDTDAMLNDVDRPIVTGDLVVMDIKVEQPDSEAEPFETSDFMYTVGSNAIAPEVDGLIVGLRAGEVLTVDSNPTVGMKAVYTMTLKQVKERVLPELTDEWVEENTEWTTVQEMRDQVMEQMGKMKVAQAQMSQRDAALTALANLIAETDIPEILIDAEANERLHNLGHRLSQQNMTLEAFLQATQQGPEDLLASLKNESAMAVRVDLALRALAKAEGLEPSDAEVDEELETTAVEMGAKAAVLKENLIKNGRIVSFIGEVAKMKANKWLTENVVYVDPLGNVIDRELLSVDLSADLDA
jgi:trigger factor